MPAARLHVLPALLLLTLPLPAQKKTAPPTPQQAEDAVLLADVQAFDLWLKDYKTGAFRLVKNGAVDEAALQQVDERMGKLAKWNVIGAAKMLFEAASVEPVLPGAHASTEVADFHRELQPWRVQALAQKHLRTMTGPGIVDWLIDML
ncbi:MAG TPA: hypothetical protein VK348_15940, partial [Planctomycetota bacterium]|nr:hypothetical protein [Planctomycetota bacterium]